MTPEERKHSERELLDEYKESVACLNLLNHSIDESLRVIAAESRDVGRVQGREPISERCLAYADGLRSLVEDYRATRERCVTLRSALSEWSSVIAELPHPRR